MCAWGIFLYFYRAYIAELVISALLPVIPLFTIPLHTPLARFLQVDSVLIALQIALQIILRRSHSGANLLDCSLSECIDALIDARNRDWRGG